jgi:hypothetical protein
MNDVARTYRIVILPAGRVAATGLALNEAAAWISTYNAIMEDHPLRAVVDEERISHSQALGLRFPLKTPPLRKFLRSAGERQQSGTRRAA